MKTFYSKSLLIRLFLSFLILTTFVLIGASLFTYLNYRQQIIAESSDVSQKMLSQAEFTIEFIRDSLFAYFFQLYNDPDIFNSIYGTEISVLDEVTTRQKLLQAIIANPLLYSIYIYNGNTGTFYSSQAIPQDEATFFDQDLVLILSKPALYAELRLIPRKIHFTLYATEYRQNVLSLIYTDSPVAQWPLEGALILNVKVDQIYEIIRAMSSEYRNDEFIVVDDKGVILAHQNSDCFLTDLSSETYIQRVLSASVPAGTITEVIAGQKSLVTYVTSEKLQWHFIRITAYDNLLAKTRGMRNLLIIFCTGLFLITLLLALWFSARLYAPINALVTRVGHHLESLVGIEAQPMPNELEYVSDAFIKVLKHVEILQIQAQNNQSFIRQELLKKLLLGEPSTYPDPGKKFQELGIAIAPQMIRVLILRIDQYWHGFCQQFQPANQALIRLALQNLAREMLTPVAPNEIVDMGNDLLAVLLNNGDTSNIRSEESLREAIQRLQEMTRKNLGITISGSIGASAAQLAELPAIYRATVELSRYRLVYGYESILTCQILANYHGNTYHYPEKCEKLILDHVRLRKADQVEKYVHELFAHLEAMPYDAIMRALVRFLTAAVQTIHAMTPGGHAASPNDLDLFQQELKRFDLLGDIQSWFMGMLQEAMRSEGVSVKDSKQQYVERLLQIIHTEYRNPNLTVEELASRLGLSANYLRILFKEATSRSLSEYLNHIRMEHAQSLLLETDISVQEVCEKIGITNVNYFYTAFKKFSGFTPTQFRTNAQQDGSQSSGLG